MAGVVERRDVQATAPNLGAPRLALAGPTPPRRTPHYTCLPLPHTRRTVKCTGNKRDQAVRAILAGDKEIMIASFGMLR